LLTSIDTASAFGDRCGYHKFIIEERTVTNIFINSTSHYTQAMHILNTININPSDNNYSFLNIFNDFLKKINSF